MERMAGQGGGGKDGKDGGTRRADGGRERNDGIRMADERMERRTG